MHKSTDIVKDLVFKLNQYGIKTEMMPSQDSYVLTHNFSKEQFHTKILAIMVDISLIPQNSDWLPGDPCNIGEGSDSYGYYLIGKEYDVDSSGRIDPLETEFWGVDIFISDTELQWV